MRWRAIVAGVGLVLLVVLAASVAGTVLVVSRPLPHPDVVISLASHEWERLPAAARLASDNPAAIVVLTLPQPATVYNCHDCAGRVRRLQRLGVSPDRVRTVPITAPGTHGEALAALTFAREEDVRRLMIVTSPYHTKRSLATFRSVFDGSGVEIGIEPAASSPARPERWWATGYDRAYVAYEWTARLYYAMRYGVTLWSWRPRASTRYCVGVRTVASLVA